MAAPKQQSQLFKGIYEFEDPSGTLIAAKVPATGSIDLFDGTVVVVKPTQCAIFVYEGRVCDVLTGGTHELKTANLPILTRLANWKLGFQSPLRCELIFFSGQSFVSRRWGTSQPVLHQFDGGKTLPVRGFGQYTVRMRHPQKFYTSLFGSRSTYSIVDLEETIQGAILEQLPVALDGIRTLPELSRRHDAVSQNIEKLVAPKFEECGIRITDVQVASLLPPKEVLDAMDSKAAMDMIGDPKAYMVYKAANGLGAGEAKSDPMQAMMSLLFAKQLASEAPRGSVPRSGGFCSGCGSSVEADFRFCPHCGQEKKA
ncbi:MAG: SPFH domain-containing protein [Bdellovibrionota bacterium]